MKKIENNFQLTGFIATDAVTRKFNSASVARFTLAVSRPEKQNEETKYVSALVTVEIWRKNEATETFDLLKKGNMVTIEGYFKPEEWTDDAGKERSRISMVAMKCYLTPDKEEEKTEEDKAERSKKKTAKK